MLGPRKTSAVDDGSAKRSAMAAEKFCQRMNGDIGAVVERLQQDRRSDCVVDDERDTVAMRGICQRLDVANIAGGIADRLREHRLGVVVDQPFDVVGLVAFGKTGGDTLARQDMTEQGVRGAIKLRHGNNVPAAIGEIDDREMQRGLAGRDRERADAAFEFGDALLENGGGRIGNPAVAVAFRLEVEQGSTVIGTVKGVGGGLVDRNSDRFGGRIGLIAGVNGDRFVAHCPPPRMRDALQHAFGWQAIFVRGGRSRLQ